MSDFLDEHAAAAKLGLAPNTLTRWRWAGVGPVFYRIGSRKIQYAVTDLDAFAQAGRVEHGTAA